MEFTTEVWTFEATYGCPADKVSLVNLPGPISGERMEWEFTGQVLCPDRHPTACFLIPGLCTVMSADQMISSHRFMLLAEVRVRRSAAEELAELKQAIKDSEMGVMRTSDGKVRVCYTPEAEERFHRSEDAHLQATIDLELQLREEIARLKAAPAAAASSPWSQLLDALGTGELSVLLFHLARREQWSGPDLRKSLGWSGPQLSRQLEELRKAGLPYGFPMIRTIQHPDPLLYRQKVHQLNPHLRQHVLTLRAQADVTATAEHATQT